MNRQMKDMTIKEIRETALFDGCSTEQIFWLGQSNKGDGYSAELFFYFPNFASWLMNRCQGKKENVVEEMHSLFASMERQILQLTEMFTEEDQERSGVGVLPWVKPASRISGEYQKP